MGNGAGAKTSSRYLDLLAHYNAELVQNNGTIVVRSCGTGTALPFEKRGKLLMVKLLLEEFGTVDAANAAIQDYKSSHS